jgi:hypothetical protein
MIYIENVSCESEEHRHHTIKEVVVSESIAAGVVLTGSLVLAFINASESPEIQLPHKRLELCLLKVPRKNIVHKLVSFLDLKGSPGRPP